VVAAYPDDGLAVIGVHTPEFSFEHEIDRVRPRSRSERSPIRSWSTTATTSGARSTITTGGRSISSTQKASSATNSLAKKGRGVEAPADCNHLETPETYLGYERSERFAPADGATFEPGAYRLPKRLPLNHWALAGDWTIGRENVVLERPGGSIATRFHARDAHLVLSPGKHEPIPFLVLLDGEAPGPSAGVDVDEEGNGVLRDGRLYQLVRQREAVRERAVMITFLDAGAEGYVFTFG